MKSVLFAWAILVATVVQAADSTPTFQSLIGDVKTGAVAKTDTYDVPFLFWGGDVATFVANGGLKTKPDSIYGKLGLKLNLVPGDDFIQQVKNYKSGKTPFLRGTFTQITQAYEVLGSDPSTKPVIVMQMTWSAGDHMVVRDPAHVDKDGKVVLDKRSILNDLKGKKICLQQGGPHVGLVDDALKAAGLKWSDITVVWATDLSETENSPAKMMRRDKTIDVACVISPDMLSLCGGLEENGNGGEGNVLGAHVIVSTAQMSRSIADVYAVRSDFFKSDKPTVEKFVAGFCKGAEVLVEAKAAYNDGKGKSPTYIAYLTMAQQIFGVKNLPTIEVDSHGLVSDVSFVGIAGNESFFEDRGNLNGFDAKLKSGLDTVTTLGYTKSRVGFDHAHLSWQNIATLAGVEYHSPKAITGRIKAEAVDIRPETELEENTLASFDIGFAAEQEAFNTDVYSADFQQVVQTASTFGNAVIVVRGHADPYLVLSSFVKAGLSSGVLKRTGSKSTGYQYYLNGKPFDLSQVPSVIVEIEKGNFKGTKSEENPQMIYQATLNLSHKRAENVKKSLVEYAASKGVNLDPTQIQASGIGIREPVVARPQSLEDMAKNRRVEFRVIKVSSEAVNKPDFDY